MENKRQKGTRGEVLAARYLEEKGYSIVATNYRCKCGEVDLIVTDQNYLVFVEVKLRKSDEFGLPREAVHGRKQQRIIKVASWYMATHQLTDTFIRFDVVEVYDGTKESIVHIENAFWC